MGKMTDEWIDADKLRDVINEQLSSYPHGTAGHHVAEEIACKLGALFPDPQPRTLADMDDDEREACQWMQATFTKSHHEHIITQVFGKKARLLRRDDGAVFEVHHDEVIPLPDLPRMVWPDERPVAAADYAEGVGTDGQDN